MNQNYVSDTTGYFPARNLIIQNLDDKVSIWDIKELLSEAGIPCRAIGMHQTGDFAFIVLNEHSDAHRATDLLDMLEVNETVMCTQFICDEDLPREFIDACEHFCAAFQEPEDNEGDDFNHLYHGDQEEYLWSSPEDSEEDSFNDSYLGEEQSLVQSDTEDELRLEKPDDYEDDFNDWHYDEQYHGQSRLEESEVQSESESCLETQETEESCDEIDYSIEEGSSIEDPGDESPN